MFFKYKTSLFRFMKIYQSDHFDNFSFSENIEHKTVAGRKQAKNLVRIDCVTYSSTIETNWLYTLDSSLVYSISIDVYVFVKLIILYST